MWRGQVMGTWVSWMYDVPDTFICCCFLVDVKQLPFLSYFTTMVFCLTTVQKQQNGLNTG